MPQQQSGRLLALPENIRPLTRFAYQGGHNRIATLQMALLPKLYIRGVTVDFASCYSKWLLTSHLHWRTRCDFVGTCLDYKQLELGTVVICPQSWSHNRLRVLGVAADLYTGWWVMAKGWEMTLDSNKHCDIDLLGCRSYKCTARYNVTNVNSLPCSTETSLCYFRNYC
jgi:hypothetical protein